jgi:ABC-type transport system involved in cytochrome c biogenesis permease subunit
VTRTLPRLRTAASLLAGLLSAANLSPISSAQHGQADPHAGHDHGLAPEPSRTQPWTDATLEMAGRLPIQEAGRIKPFSTWARFTLLRLNGKSSVELGEAKLDPTAWMLDVLFFPQDAHDYPAFLVSNDEVIVAMGLSFPDRKKRDHYAFAELQPGLRKLFELANDYMRVEEKQRSAVQREVVVLASNLDLYMRYSAQLEWARMSIPIAGEVQHLFGGAADAEYHEVVAQAGALRAIYNGEDEAASRAAIGPLSIAMQLSDASTSLAILPPAVPVAQDREWHAPGELFELSYNGDELSQPHMQVLAGLRELGANRTDPRAFEASLVGVLAQTQALAEARGEYSKVPLEVTYYKANLIMNSLVLFILAFVGVAVLWLRPRSKVVYGLTSGTVLVATLMLVGAIVLRCIIRSRPPVSTLYETLLFVAAVGCLTALAIEVINKRRVALSLAAVCGMVFLFLANGYETLDKQDTMPSLVAVLDTNFWLATHVTAITAGYAAGMLAALMASGYLLMKLFGFRRGDRPFYSSLGRMVYGVIAFAVIFSTVGTILGGVWANDSWGRFWGWDPKENGALLIVISQLAILHGRMGGYLREHGVCMAAAFGGTVIAFSWFGVNLLGVGLHSYGFTSGIHTALWTYYFTQWGIVGLGGVAWVLERQHAQARAKRVPAAPPKAAPQAIQEKLGKGTQPA